MSVEAVRKAFGTSASLAPVSRKIDFGNGNPITVGPGQTAIPLSSSAESISLVNTGDLTGGIGIDVATGAIDLGTALVNDTQTLVFASGSVPLYDDAGNRVVDGYGYPAYIATNELTYNFSNVILARDPADSTIAIDNGGKIDFAGRHGIRASNPAGQSIDIVNSGDIVATADTEFRSGIYARTDVYESTNTITQTAVGERTYNQFGQVTGVVAPDQYTVDNSTLDMEYDGGAIAYDNSGNIDMGATLAPPAFGGPSVWASVGIQAVGDGGTTILNSGDIKVDKWSAGIDVRSTATTSIENSGRIDIGNYSAGIAFSPSQGTAGDYRLGGDVYIVNSGEIHGGATRDELARRGRVRLRRERRQPRLEQRVPCRHRAPQRAAFRVQRDPRLGRVPNLRLPERAAVRHDGRERRADRAQGRRGRALHHPPGRRLDRHRLGHDIVGDGGSIPENNIASPSAGIFQTNFPVNGLGLTASINTESGVIVAGDDSAGIRNLNIGGDSPRSTKARSRRQRPLEATSRTRVARAMTGCSSRPASPPSALRRKCSAPPPTPATAARSRPATCRSASSSPGRASGCWTRRTRPRSS